MAAAADYASGALAFAQRQADRVVSPPARERAARRARALADEQPLLFTFLAAQLLAALVPAALFAAFALSAAGLALGAALVFTLFWTGAALLVLAPALCLASAASLLLWAWAAAVFLAARWCRAALAGAGAGAAPAVNGDGPGGYAPLKQEQVAGGRGDGAQASLVPEE